MNGLTIVETPTMLELLDKLEIMSQRIEELAVELKGAKKPYLSSQEVMEMTGFGKTWVNQNKGGIGFTTIGGCIRFKRIDVEEYIEANYFKATNKRKTNKKYSCIQET